MRSAWMLSACSTIFIVGCSVTQIATHTPTGTTGTGSSAGTGADLKGRVHGGQQPIQGAQVYLLELATNGYGNQSKSLLTGTGNVGINSWDYVITNSNGGFSIGAGEYTCDTGDQVYLYSLSGNPQVGGGNNTSAGLMAVVGQCLAGNTFSGLPPTIQMNEVTTVAAAYALAGFAKDATDMSGDSGAATGMANAAAAAGNLVNLGTGSAYATNPGGNGAVPQSEINTLANILAACINSSGAVTGPTNPTPCYTLFTNALSGGTTGTQPTDTATAAINIAHNPGANVGALWDLETSTAPFQPSLTSSTPNDWTLAVAYGGNGLFGPTNVAIDTTGNVWVTNSDGNSISEFSNLGGATLVTATGAGGLNSPFGIAIDATGYVWVTNHGGSGSISEFNSTGVAQSGVNGITGGTLNGPLGIAIDLSGNVWVANFGNSTVSEYDPGTAGFLTVPSGGGVDDPFYLAVDAGGNIWVNNWGGPSVTEFSGATATEYTGGGTAGLSEPVAIAVAGTGDIWIGNEGNTSPYDISILNGSGVTQTTGSTGLSGGGLDDPWGLAIDGADDVWLANFEGKSLSEFSPSQVPVTSATGYQGLWLNPSNQTLGPALNEPEGLAIDSSGNIWVADAGNNNVVEFVGAAAPVATPLVYATKNGLLGARP